MIRRSALTILAAIGPVLAFAGEGYLGTKPSAGGAAASLDTGTGQGITPFLQMVIALGVVLALVKFVLPKIAGKVGKKLVTSPTSGLRVEETAHFAGGTLYIVQARSKTLLLSVNGTSVNCLSDLTEPANAPAEPPTFQEIVETAMEAPITAAAFVPAEEPKNVIAESFSWEQISPDAIRSAVRQDSPEEALRRLERLVG